MSARLFAFVCESNRIEGIQRPPLASELEAHGILLKLNQITVTDMEWFVRVVANAGLRRDPGMDVHVGNNKPIPGGPNVVTQLMGLLEFVRVGMDTPYRAHHRYETLHPFMDGNGRSGRALWAWQMLRDGEDPFALPFLHTWYYQSLAEVVR